MRLPSASMMEDFWRAARLRRLEREPFTPDRLGMYASLWQQTLPHPSVCVYLFDAKKMLLSRQRLLVAGAVTPQAYCPLLPRVFREANASFLGLSVCAREFGTPRMTDVMPMASASLFCEQENIAVLDMILLYETGYIPLSRTGGAEELYHLNLLDF